LPVGESAVIADIAIVTAASDRRFAGPPQDLIERPRLVSCRMAT